MLIPKKCQRCTFPEHNIITGRCSLKECKALEGKYMMGQDKPGWFTGIVHNS